MAGTIYDLAIIGGGINGCGIARDAAGRGLSVYLCEQGDLASATSSASTKLIHGGLRYLEHYAFRLVREALAEREVLLANAPHIIRPMRFVLPHHDGLRPRWFLRLGLFFYDHLGGTQCAAADEEHQAEDRPGRRAAEGDLHERVRIFRLLGGRLRAWWSSTQSTRGTTARASIRASAARLRSDWERVGSSPFRTATTGQSSTVAARVLVNAAGPWVGDVLQSVLHTNNPAPVRLVKGSHIVVRKLFDHDRAYIFQNADGRIIFAIPYERDFTLLGTTDTDYQGDPADVAADAADIDYICEAASEYFLKPVRRDEIVWTYSGVRPLYDDGASKAQEATRDYVLKLDAPDGGAPLLTVFGGKITTYRRLAESVLAMLTGFLPAGAPWTAKAPLPGGDFPVGGAPDLARALHNAYPFLEETHLQRLVRAYGTRTADIIGGARSYADLGISFGGDLTEAEVAYLVANECAETATDILWRRSKLGLHLNRDDQEALEAYLVAQRHKPRRVAAGGAAP